MKPLLLPGAPLLASVWVSCIPLALLVALPWIVFLALDVYVPGYDETFQVEAAVRLSQGLGYTASRLYPLDLSVPYFSYLIGWPVGYSQVLNWMLQAGVPVGVAPKLVKLVALFVAVVAWTKFSATYLRSRVGQSVFAAFMGLFLVICSSSAPDLIVLALFPVFTMWILSATDDGADAKGRILSRRAFLALAGAIAGLVVLMKYTGLSVAILGGTWLLLANRRRPLRMFADLACYCVPAGAIIGSVFLSNLLNAGALSPTTMPSWSSRTLGWDMSWVFDSVTAMLFSAPYLPKVLIRFVIAPFGQPYESVGTYATLGTIALVTANAMFHLHRAGGSPRRLAGWLVVAYLSAFFFLGLSSSLYFSGGGWAPIMEGRYYQWIVPALAVGLLAWLSSTKLVARASRISLRAMEAGACLGFFSLALLFANYWHSTSEAIATEARDSYQVIDLLRAGPDRTAPALIVIADPDNFMAFPWKGEVNVFPTLEPLEQKTAFFSRRTLVAIVCSTSAIRIDPLGDDNCLQKGFAAYANSHGFDSRSTGPRNRVYWKEFSPGPVQREGIKQ